MRLKYPFAAVPNQIVRGGHGAINLAVFTALLSHGTITASAETIADEIGCSRRSVFNAISYWAKNGEKNGIKIRSTSRLGETTIYDIEITHMCTPTRATGAHKEEPLKKRGAPLPPQVGRTSLRSLGKNPRSLEEKKKHAAKEARVKAYREKYGVDPLP